MHLLQPHFEIIADTQRALRALEISHPRVNYTGDPWSYCGVRVCIGQVPPYGTVRKRLPYFLQSFLATILPLVPAGGSPPPTATH
jgi:hypothetical protein